MRLFNFPALGYHVCMMHFLIVALGGGLGAGCRHLVGQGALRLMGPNFPYGTLIVNVVGSFVMGLFIAYLARRSGSLPNEIRLFFATGFLGGFTTFSSFSLDFATLVERHEMALAFGYAAITVTACLVAVFAGLLLVRALA